jgi:hypothetical protein
MLRIDDFHQVLSKREEYMGFLANKYKLNILAMRYFRLAKGRNTLVINETYSSWLKQMELTSFKQLMFGDTRGWSKK